MDAEHCLLRVLGGSINRVDAKFAPFSGSQLDRQFSCALLYLTFVGSDDRDDARLGDYSRWFAAGSFCAQDFTLNALFLARKSKAHCDRYWIAPQRLHPPQHPG